MLEFDSTGDYDVSGRLVRMTSSRHHLLADIRLSDDDECVYDSTRKSSSAILTGNMGSYEAFSRCHLRSDFTDDGSSDESQSCYGATSSQRLESVSSGVDINSFDPFPELTENELTPVSARIYSLDDLSSRTSKSNDIVTSRTRAGPSLRSSNTTRQSSSERVTINFYTDERNFVELSVTGDTTAAEVCDHLIRRNNAVHSPHWTLVEHNGRHRLERGVEHHEIVYDIYKTWSVDEDCRFFFRKDYSKYELFRNPAQFFPENMVDCKMSVRDDGWLTRSERYKNLLLQNLLANQSIPDIHGYLQMRDKRSWKKHFCVLRGSGLYYSTKGNHKDPQYLVLLSTMEDVNIYASQNTKKVFGAPNNFGICLKPANAQSDVKQFKLFCAEDEQTRLCWLTGMRFVKYGAQLRENFRLTLRCDEENGRSNSGSTSSQGSNDLYVSSRVPMDFSGERGHVVTDPNEALTIAFEEAYNWRKKALMRNPPRPVQSFYGNEKTMDQVTAVPHALPSRQYPLHVASSIHVMQPWFHGHISREEATRLIAEHGLVDGVFLIRNSQSIPNIFVLSFAHNQKVKHCTINKIVEADGHVCYSLDNTTKFMDLIQLVDFYQLNAGVLPTQLAYHVTRL